MKLIINEKERGLFFHNGKFMKVLGPGKYAVLKKEAAARYRTLTGEIEVRPFSHCPITSELAGADALLRSADLQSKTETVEVADGEIAVRFVNGLFSLVLGAGRYLFWKDAGAGKTVKYDITSPFIPEELPAGLLSRFGGYVKEFRVEAKRTGLLFVDGKYVKTLPAGVHRFWNGAYDLSVATVPAGLELYSVQGQEILTADKVTLRLNCVCAYRVADPVRAYTEVGDYLGALHVAVQLALRDFVGSLRLDEVLENKEDLSARLFGRLKEKEGDLFLTVEEAAVKDIILPGEIRDIMNTVLVAEKKAQANVIARREEVASTRSLLNTAKLLEENQTLYRLKELEYIERIFGSVGNINFTGGGDILSQLTAALSGNKT